jgi:hypothetical protein
MKEMPCRSVGIKASGLVSRRGNAEFVVKTWAVLTCIRSPDPGSPGTDRSLGLRRGWTAGRHRRTVITPWSLRQEP